jgi:hypothetical protein
LTGLRPFEVIILMLISDMPNITLRITGSLPTVKVCLAAMPFVWPST